MSAIVDNPEAYFSQFVPERSALLMELEEEARRDAIPIIGPVVGELLYILARISRAKRILELGTATGYSAIFLASACDDIDAAVVTLEQDATMAEKALKNFQAAGLQKRIELRVCDALQELAHLDTVFDLIFMDIEKQDYLLALPHFQTCLRKGGLLVADNVGFKDADGFNRAIASQAGWRSVSLFSYLPAHSPEYDGICLAMHE
ncbi:MAG: O-methyltransferase [Deltaproteobacteria bacterium]|jgi:predicted O-methyltransferase YrrM|nr:O-methyltransferase [Deltaproteobacteria bacterium]MBW2488995.1 O-methyltransferase [Deltaproteobacteria bacterium]